MEQVAAFVFGSGGVVSVTELQRFFTQQPRVESAFFAEAAPVRQLKKIVRHFGAAHGLAWLDADAVADAANGMVSPCVVHNLTDAQRTVFPSTVLQQIPLALDALATLLHGTPGARLKMGELGRFYVAFPEETAFVRARCGSVAAFVATYDANATRIGVSATELWLVGSVAPSMPTVSTIATAPSSATSGVTSEGDAESIDIDDFENETTGDDTDRGALVRVAGPVLGLQALRVVWNVLSQLRVARSRVSLSGNELLVHVWRLVARRWSLSYYSTAFLVGTNSTKAASHVTRQVARAGALALAPEAPEAPACPHQDDPQQQATRRRRRRPLLLLVPDAAQGLTWTWVPNTPTGATT